MKEEMKSMHPQKHEPKHYEGIETPFVKNHGDNGPGSVESHKPQQEHTRSEYHGK